MVPKLIPVFTAEGWSFQPYSINFVSRQKKMKAAIRLTFSFALKHLEKLLDALISLLKSLLLSVDAKLQLLLVKKRQNNDHRQISLKVPNVKFDVNFRFLTFGFAPVH